MAGPAKTFKDILAICNENGYSSEKCKNRFYGNNRGIFSLSIMKDDLAKAESELDKFYKSYGNKLTIYFLKVDLNFDVNVTPKFDLITDDKFAIISENYIELMPYRDEDPVSFVLVKDEGIWKLGVTNDFEKPFRKTDAWAFYLLGKTRTNIIRYHIEKAKALKLTESEVIHQIAIKSIPLLIAMDPDKAEKFKDYLSIDVNSVINEFAPLDTKDKIMKKLELENS